MLLDVASFKLSLLPFFIVLLQMQLDLENVAGLPSQLKIGILLHEQEIEQGLMFRWSIDQVNRRGLLNNRTRLQGLIKRVGKRDCWDAERRACQLLSEGAIAIIGPSDHQSSTHVGSICDALDVPHLNVAPRGVVFSSQPTTMSVGDSSSSAISSNQAPVAETVQSSISIDLTVPRPGLTQAYLDVLNSLGWRKFVYLYERDDSLFHLQQHYNGKSIKTSNEHGMKVMRFDPSKPYRDTFWSLRRSDVRQIMLDVRCSNLRQVLKHAQQVSMMTEAHSYLIVCLDTQTLDLDDFLHSRARIVWLSLIARDSEAMAELTASGDQHLGGSAGYPSAVQISGQRLKTESALIHDAIESFAITMAGAELGQYLASAPGEISCQGPKPWSHGSTLVNYMRTSVELEAMTGSIQFDAAGQRANFKLAISRLTSSGPRQIGNWSSYQPIGAKLEPGFTKVSLPSSFGHLFIETHELQYLRRGDLTIYEDQERDLLIITSIKNDPYLMNKQTTRVERGNSRYEGYAVDLIDELSKLVGFDYVFKEVDDGKYGVLNTTTNEWNGMIREVMIGKADLAIADLSITAVREDAVDFTQPFMSTGISILFKKPTTKELELFSFLSPFEKHVWVYVCCAYLGVSVLLFVVGRISPYEWADPHPCRRENKVLRNQFSLSNAFWFTIAAVMQQGSDLAPRSLSTRMVASFWYFFTLIMISSYTANLAAFLTIERVIYPIERAEDLYHNKERIEYGFLESGSTGNFFKDSKNGSTFRQMYNEMVVVPSNDIGKNRVEQGNYAYFMESTSIEYTVERFCNLTQIGGLLDSKGYGIALAKNSTRKRDYRTRLSEAIVSLQESGTLEVLKNRWWKEKRGGGACDAEEGHSSGSGDGVRELTMANVGGVFVVLGMGITISFILCAIELYAKSCRLATARGTSRWTQVKRRIIFALSLSENY